MSDADTSQLTSKIKSLQDFKASTHWFYNFMARNRFSSFKPRGQNGMHADDAVETERQALRAMLCMTNPKDIANTDEVAVLFRSFPSRTVGTTDKAS